MVLKNTAMHQKYIGPKGNHPKFNLKEDNNDDTQFDLKRTSYLE